MLSGSGPMLYPMEIGIAQRILAIIQEETARYKVTRLTIIRLVVGEALIEIISGRKFLIKEIVAG